MMVSRATLNDLATRSGFRAEILEKVIHLLNLLEGFRSHPYLKSRFALKGGTALNLFHFDIPRLSVDIDINYIGSADRETMLAERPKVEQAIRAVCEREGMTIKRLPTDHAGGKWRLSYRSALTETATLEVDVNFLTRVPLWQPMLLDSRPVGDISASAIPVLDRHELAAGKLVALLARRASRDLFDAHELLTAHDMDRSRLRLGFVVYGAMNRRDWRTVAIDDIAFDEAELRSQLLPVLRTDLIGSESESKGWAARLVERCRAEAAAVLPLAEHERGFLERLIEHGEIDPALLTEDADMMERIATHPGLKWKALNVQRHKSGQ